MATNLEELVWAKKEGFAKRQFTRRQLSAMGDDVNGSGHDGWHIVESVEEPAEVKEAKRLQAEEAKAKAEKEKADKAAAKAAADKEKADKKAAAKAAADKEKADKKAAAKESKVTPLNPDQGDQKPADATKTDTDNGQIDVNSEESAERSTEGTDVSGPTTT